MLQEQQGAVVHAWQASAPRAVLRGLLVAADDLLLLLLPVHAEGRVGDEVVEGLPFELVVGEAVAVLDVLSAAVVVDLLHEHVGCCRREGALVVVLAVDVELRFLVVIAHVALCLGKHAPRAARRVEHAHDGAWLAEHVVGIHEEKIDHEVDHLARREVIARGFISQFVEASDEVFEYETHLIVLHPVGMKVDLQEFLQDQIEDVRLVHLLDFVGELEEVEYPPDVSREAADV